MTESEQSKPPLLTLKQIVVPIWAERKRILLISLVVGLVTLGVNFLLPKYYRATTLLLPESDKNKLGALSQFAGLASLAGVNVPSGDVSRLYPTILTSESILRNAIEKKYLTERFKDSVNLIRYFELEESTPEENFDKALKTLRDLIKTSFDTKTNVVTVTLEMREPQLAADVLNGVVEQLDSYMRLKKITSASEQRKWIDSRLEQVKLELRQAEEALKNFRERNRRVSDSPELLLQSDRLLRDVQVKSTIDVELMKQSELAKIEEIKNISIVNVLDEARPPVKKERPKRATNAVIACLLAAIALSTYYVLGPVYGQRVKEFFRSLKLSGRRA